MRITREAYKELLDRQTIPVKAKRKPVLDRPSPLEAEFKFRLKLSKLPFPEQEYRFDETRKWRFDFAWPSHKIAVELEGGLWIQGRHNRAKGMIADMEKYNKAILSGWRVLRYTAENLASAIPDILYLLQNAP